MNTSLEEKSVGAATIRFVMTVCVCVFVCGERERRGKGREGKRRISGGVF